LKEKKTYLRQQLSDKILTLRPQWTKFKFHMKCL